MPARSERIHLETSPAPRARLVPRLLLRALTVAAILAVATHAPGAAFAADKVRFAGAPSLSEDGSTMVFAWRGDLWSAPTAGGPIARLTTHPADDRDPHLSPDGEHVAFISTRSGSSQVWIMPSRGGAPSQVTVHTEGFGLEGWYPDGSSLLVSGSRDHFWRRSERLFRQSLEGTDAPEILFDDYGSDASLSHDGRHVLFTREGTRWWRKGYHGPQASQIWHFDSADATFEKHTDHEQGERHPRWLGDGTYLFSSQASGTFNLYHRDPSAGTSTQLTFFEDDGIHRPVVSRDGSVVVFQRLADLYRLDVEDGARPERIDLMYDGDPWMDPIRRSTLDRATDVAFSKDAREIAFIAGGDVWVMDTELREPLRITNTPEEERDPAFAPDFGSIVFVSDSGGQCDVWKATRADEDRYWWQQEEFRLERLTRDPKPESNPRFTPDGRISFLALRGDLWIMDTDGKNAEKLIPSWNDIRYDFSPDGKWIVYAVSDDDFNRDVWIRPVDGSREPFNLSRHPDNEGDPVWSPDGTMIAFTGRRFDTEVDLFYAYLRKAGDEETARDRKLEKALEKMKGRKKPNGKKDAPSKAAKESKAKAASAASAAASPPAATRDALTGTWDGTITGPAPVPPAGLGLTIELVLAEDGTVTGTATPDGLGGAPIEDGQFDAASGKFTANIGTEQGAARLEATVKDDAMQGSWKLAIGLEGTLVATRRPLPGQPAGAGGPAAGATATAKADSDADAPSTDEADTEKEDEDRVVIDFDGLEDRIQRIAIPNSSEGSLLWSPDSKKLAFRATVGGKSGLYTIEFPDSLKPKLLTSSVGRSRQSSYDSP